MRHRSWALLALTLPLTGACGSSPVAAPQPSPPPVSSPRAAAVAYARCEPPSTAGLSLAGVQWIPGKAVRRRLGCHLSFSTLPKGGSLSVDYEPSLRPQADVRDRLRDLAASSPQRPTVRLDRLTGGTSAGGIAYVGRGAASYLLYASTSGSVISVVCAVPGRLAQQADGTETAAANALLAWALERQPA